MKGICKTPALRIYQIFMKNYKLMVFIDSSSNEKKILLQQTFRAILQRSESQKNARSYGQWRSNSIIFHRSPRDLTIPEYRKELKLVGGNGARRKACYLDEKDGQFVRAAVNSRIKELIPFGQPKGCERFLVRIISRRARRTKRVVVQVEGNRKARTNDGRE